MLKMMVLVLAMIIFQPMTATATAADSFAGEWIVSMGAEGVYEDGNVDNNVTGTLKISLKENKYNYFEGKVMADDTAIGTVYLFPSSDNSSSAELAVYINSPVILMSDYTMTISCRLFVKSDNYLMGVLSGSLNESGYPFVLFHGRVYMSRPSADGGKG